MEFSERLKICRSKSGFSQVKLAEAIGVRQKDISRWESGVYTPNIDYVVLICKALDISADVLLGLKDA